MAGTITLTSGAEFVNGSLSITDPVASQTITQTTQGVFTDTQTITTSETAVTIGSIATLGIVKLQNLDAANYVDFGSYVTSVFYPLVRLNAGESFYFRVKPGLTLYAQANTASVKLQKTIAEA